jgi:hypothetical protein
MDLEIINVEGKGEIEKECLWLKATNDIPDLVYYIISDTTYTDDKHISNELRHIFWFPHNSQVKAGDWVKLVTNDAKNTSFTNRSNTTTYVYHWKLGRTVWNKGKDQAVLFKVDTWTSKAV